MPGTKSLSGSESLPEAQDLMLHTPPANRWLPEVPLPLFFSFVPPFFCPGLMNRFVARPVTPKAIQTLFCPFMVLLYRFFKDLCRPLSRQFIKKRMAHLRQSIFCVKIQKHLDCAKGIADHDSGLLHPVNLRSVTLYTGWMASIFWLQSFVSQNGAGAPQCFFSLALKRPIKNTGFLL